MTRDKKPSLLKLARMCEELAAVIETYQHPFSSGFRSTRNALERRAEAFRLEARKRGEKR